MRGWLAGLGMALVGCSGAAIDPGVAQDAKAVQDAGSGSPVFTPDSAPGSPDASNIPCGDDACVSTGRTCGPVLDSCGVTVDCGTCEHGSTCSAAGACEVLVVDAGPAPEASLDPDASPEASAAPDASDDAPRTADAAPSCVESNGVACCYPDVWACMSLNAYENVEACCSPDALAAGTCYPGGVCTQENYANGVCVLPTAC